MKKTLIVILVSEQTIQNVQFLKWYFRNNLQTCEIMFVTTEKMEQKQKSNHIKNALDYIFEKFVLKTTSLIVDENSIEEFMTSETQNGLQKLKSAWKATTGRNRKNSAWVQK